MDKKVKLGIAITVTLILYTLAFFFIDFLGSTGGVSLLAGFWILVVYGIVGVGVGLLLQFVHNKYKFEKKKESIINAIVGVGFYFLFGLLPVSGVVIGMIILEKPKK